MDKLRDLLKDNDKGFKCNRQRQALRICQARQLMKDRNKNKDKTRQIRHVCSEALLAQ